MVDVTVEGLDMTYKVGQTTAKARLDAWMTPAHDLGPCRVRRSDRAMDAGLVSVSLSTVSFPGRTALTPSLKSESVLHTPHHVVSVQIHF